jgi:L-threonylcarbamoyladenylate synthase
VASTESSSHSPGESSRPTILRPQEGALSAAELDLCCDVFERGGLIAFPTDTVYGVGCDAGNPEAVRRVFGAKRRPPTKPLAVLVRGGFVGLFQSCPPPAPPDAAVALAREFWPGPLTIVVSRSKLICPEAVAGGDTVGVRDPDLWLARQLLHSVSGPMAVTSANLSGEDATVSPQEVLRTLGPCFDVLIDAEVPASGVPSTVIDLTKSPPRLLRQGAITLDQLRSVIGEVVSPWKDPLLEL